MADQEQYQDDQGQEGTPRRQTQQLPQRSTASNNWRAKDDAPRGDTQPRANRQSGSYGSSPRFGGQQREASDTRLYVGNLLYSAQKDDVAQFFTENGFNVVNLSMSIDPLTGRNPSYCFADFETADDASRAMAELNGKDVLGRAVRINPGVAKRQNGEQSAEPRTNSFGNRSFGRDAPQDGQRPSYGARYNSGEKPYSSYNNRENQENQGSGKRLYVGNLPNISSEPSEVEATVKSLFDSIGIEITNVSKLIAPHESKGPGDFYYLFVDLARADDADAVIEALNDKTPTWSETPLRVNKAREQGARRPPRERQGYGQREGQGYGQREGQGYGQREGGYRERRTEGFRDWRTSRQENVS